MVNENDENQKMGIILILSGIIMNINEPTFANEKQHIHTDLLTVALPHLLLQVATPSSSSSGPNLPHLHISSITNLLPLS